MDRARPSPGGRVIAAIKKPGDLGWQKLGHGCNLIPVSYRPIRSIVADARCRLPARRPLPCRRRDLMPRDFFARLNTFAVVMDCRSRAELNRECR
jgi:hypothetical protein